MADTSTKPYLLITQPSTDGILQIGADANNIKFKAVDMIIGNTDLNSNNKYTTEVKNIKLYCREKGTTNWTLAKEISQFASSASIGTAINSWNTELPFSAAYGMISLKSIPNYKLFTSYEYYIQADYIITFNSTSSANQNTNNSDGTVTLGIVDKAETNSSTYTLKSHIRTVAFTPSTTNGSIRSRVNSSTTEIYPAFNYSPSDDKGSTPVLPMKVNDNPSNIPLVDSGNVFAGKVKIKTNSGIKHLAKKNPTVPDSGLPWDSTGSYYKKYTQSYQENLPESYFNGTYHYSQYKYQYLYNYYGYNTNYNTKYSTTNDLYQEYYNTSYDDSNNYYNYIKNTYSYERTYKISSYYYTNDLQYNYNYQYLNRQDRHETINYYTYYTYYWSRYYQAPNYYAYDSRYDGSYTYKEKEQYVSVYSNGYAIAYFPDRYYITGYRQDEYKYHDRRYATNGYNQYIDYYYIYNYRQYNEPIYRYYQYSYESSYYYSRTYITGYYIASYGSRYDPAHPAIYRYDRVAYTTGTGYTPATYGTNYAYYYGYTRRNWGPIDVYRYGTRAYYSGGYYYNLAPAYMFFNYLIPNGYYQSKYQVKVYNPSFYRSGTTYNIYYQQSQYRYVTGYYVATYGSYNYSRAYYYQYISGYATYYYFNGYYIDSYGTNWAYRQDSNYSFKYDRTYISGYNIYHQPLFTEHYRQDQLYKEYYTNEVYYNQYAIQDNVSYNYIVYQKPIEYAYKYYNETATYTYYKTLYAINYYYISPDYSSSVRSTRYDYRDTTYYYTQYYAYDRYATAYNGANQHPQYAVDTYGYTHVYDYALRTLYYKYRYNYWDGSSYYTTYSQYYKPDQTAYRIYNQEVQNYSYRYTSYRYNSAYPIYYREYKSYLYAREF